MSKAANDWLKRQKIDDKSLMAILRGLVASTDDGVCRITQARLSKKIGMSDRNIRRGLAALDALGVIDRSKQSEWGKRGRATDVICLSVDLDFDVSKEAVSAAKSDSALSGQMSGAPHSALSGQMSGAPTISYIRKDIYGSGSAKRHRCVGRVFFESDRQLWRAKLKVDGVEFDLGRHEAREVAEAEIHVSLREIEHTASHRSGNPVDPVPDPSLKSLSGRDLADFLFGTKEERYQSGRAADRGGSGGSSPGRGRGGEAPASRSERTGA